ncbi:unnamed protein product [Amoebophrya sp. A25]|nr:unnamed protein product [Amoebophrya sp. A25]|eukprot:GSA25T00020394001.1
MWRRGGGGVDRPVSLPVERDLVGITDADNLYEFPSALQGCKAELDELRLDIRHLLSCATQLPEDASKKPFSAAACTTKEQLEKRGLGSGFLKNSFETKLEEVRTLFTSWQQKLFEELNSAKFDGFGEKWLRNVNTYWPLLLADDELATPLKVQDDALASKLRGLLQQYAKQVQCVTSPSNQRQRNDNGGQILIRPDDITFYISNPSASLVALTDYDATNKVIKAAVKFVFNLRYTLLNNESAQLNPEVRYKSHVNDRVEDDFEKTETIPSSSRKNKDKKKLKTNILSFEHTVNNVEFSATKDESSHRETHPWRLVPAGRKRRISDGNPKTNTKMKDAKTWKEFGKDTGRNLFARLGVGINVSGADRKWRVSLYNIPVSKKDITDLNAQLKNLLAKSAAASGEPSALFESRALEMPTSLQTRNPNGLAPAEKQLRGSGRSLAINDMNAINDAENMNEDGMSIVLLGMAGAGIVLLLLRFFFRRRAGARGSSKKMMVSLSSDAEEQDITNVGTSDNVARDSDALDESMFQDANEGRKTSTISTLGRRMPLADGVWFKMDASATTSHTKQSINQSSGFPLLVARGGDLATKSSPSPTKPNPIAHEKDAHEKDARERDAHENHVAENDMADNDVVGCMAFVDAVVSTSYFFFWNIPVTQVPTFSSSNLTSSIVVNESAPTWKITDTRNATSPTMIAVDKTTLSTMITYGQRALLDHDDTTLMLAASTTTTSHNMNNAAALIFMRLSSYFVTLRLYS